MELPFQLALDRTLPHVPTDFYYYYYYYYEDSDCYYYCCCYSDYSACTHSYLTVMLLRLAQIKWQNSTNNQKKVMGETCCLP